MTPLPGGDGHGVGAVQRHRFGAPSFEHDGSGPGVLAALIVIPERGLSLAVACNGGGDNRPTIKRFSEVVDQVLARVLASR